MRKVPLRKTLFALWLIFLPLASSLPAQETTGVGDWTQVGEKIGEGETCLVCNQQVHGKEMIEIRYQGRTFFVTAGMFEEFQADPDQYFRRLQATSGLFDERSVTAGMSFGWLIFGSYILVGLIFAALCGYLAIGRGHPPLPWFFAGLVGNIAALFVLLITPTKDLTGLPDGMPPGLAKVPVTHRPVPCACGASNHPAAAVCTGCRADLTPRLEAETARI